MPNDRDASAPSVQPDFSGFSNDDYSSFSWTIQSDTIAVKKTDRSVFLHHGTVIPQKIRPFFAITNMKRGEKIPIVLWNDDDRYDAFIEMTTHESPRTRMMWRSDFTSKIQTKYSQWFDFFKSGEEESEDTPSMKFFKKQVPNQYDVEFLDDSSSTVSIDFKISIKPGEIIDNEKLRTIFKCSSQGGMRRSLKTNSLVLVSDHTKSTYEDKWIDYTFHYTGMGLTGNQSLTFHQNKTVAESITNGVHLFLFEVFEEGKYVFIGEVELAGDPYIDKQPDIKKTIRDVYIFPIKIKGKNAPPILKKELIDKKDEFIRKKIHRLSLEELEFRAIHSHKESGRREVVTGVYERDPSVSEYAKLRANGICQLCNQPAPFKNLDGEPYLETHHIIQLANGGPDTIENVAALCPNCHRKMDILNLRSDVAVLKEKSSPKR
jgi:5-methylcytosine-specific restriction protein A